MNPVVSVNVPEKASASSKHEHEPLQSSLSDLTSCPALVVEETRDDVVQRDFQHDFSDAFITYKTKTQDTAESSSCQSELTVQDRDQPSIIHSFSTTEEVKFNCKSNPDFAETPTQCGSSSTLHEFNTHSISEKTIDVCEVDMTSEGPPHAVSSVSGNSVEEVQPMFDHISVHMDMELDSFTGTGREQSKSSESVPKFIGPIYPEPTESREEGETVEEMHVPTDQENNITQMRETNSDAVVNDVRYNLSATSVPTLLSSAISEFQSHHDENFLRGCKWSPDGNCLLTNSNDNYLRTFYPLTTLETKDTCSGDELLPKFRMKESSQIYDFAWHPKMSTKQSEFYRIACTCAGIPIHMWNAETGQIVANYRAYDQYDEITAAYCLSFSRDGSKIYAGYKKAIRIFDTDYPVRSCKTVKTFNSQKKDGQTGIISCFAHSPDGNGLYVAGSYSRHIGIYDAACDKLVCLMQGQQGGVTHLMFSPDGTRLYSGGRKDAEILCWDMRNMGRILFSALREVRTNQRIYFDLSQSGRYLASGNEDGSVAFWDTLSCVEEINGEAFLKPCSQFQAHKDCVNSVSFNPEKNLIATASGQRHFRNFEAFNSDESSDDTDVEMSEPWDFSLRVWQIPLLYS